MATPPPPLPPLPPLPPQADPHRLARPAAPEAARAPLTVPLADAGEHDPALVGQKARRLGQAIRASLAVPPGFVITTAALERWLGVEVKAGVSLGAALDGALEPARAAASTGRIPADLAEAVARAVRALIESAAIPVEVRGAVAAGLDRLAHAGPSGAEPTLAVRSSAPAEDGSVRSLAGQFDSYLDVRGLDAVLAATRRVVASFASARALTTLAALPPPGGLGAAMAVIVQRMVPAAWSGILFTEDPLMHAGGMVAEVVEGKGGALAEGTVTPARFALAPGGTAWERLDDGQAPSPPQGLLRALGGLGRAAEQAFGAPQDLEWAAAGERVELVQARPITATARGPHLGRDVWTAANSQEAIEDPITPLTMSFLEPLIERGRADVARALKIGDLPGAYMRVIHGRVYFNTGYFRRFLEAIPGIPPEIFDRLLFGEGPAGSLVTFPTPRPSLRLAGVGVHVARMWLAGERRFLRYEERLGRFLADAVAAPLTALDGPALLRHLARLTRHLEEGFRLHVLGSALSGGSYLLLAKLLRTAGSALDDGVVDDLLSTVPGIRTAEATEGLFELAARWAKLPAMKALLIRGGPEAALAALAEGEVEGSVELRAALAGFLTTFGHLAEKQAELARPRWREEPEAVLRILARYLEAEDEGRKVVRPHAVRGELGKRKRAVKRRAEEALRRTGVLVGPARVAAFRYLLAAAARFQPYRENMRFQALRVYEAVRAVFVELGRRAALLGALDAPEQVFFLTFEELELLFARGDAPSAERSRRLAERARVREAELARAGTTDAPKLCYEDGRPAPSPSPLHRVGADKAYLEGVGVSTGVVTGPVRRARSLEEALRLEPGAILLAEAATPAWTPAFFLARAVVLDIGGMLSHCAVIAREYGIPCVVGLRFATSILEDGDIITVDARNGRVYLPERSQPAEGAAPGADAGAGST